MECAFNILILMISLAFGLGGWTNVDEGISSFLNYGDELVAQTHQGLVGGFTVNKIKEIFVSRLVVCPDSCLARRWNYGSIWDYIENDGVIVCFGLDIVLGWSRIAWNST